MSESPLLNSVRGDEKDEDKKMKADADCNSVVFVLVSNFMLAIQYSLLMPTVWKYLKSMGSKKYMLGFVLASFTTAQCVFMPLLGKLGVKRFDLLTLSLTLSHIHIISIGSIRH